MRSVAFVDPLERLRIGLDQLKRNGGVHSLSAQQVQQLRALSRSLDAEIIRRIAALERARQRDQTSMLPSDPGHRARRASNRHAIS